MYIADLHIHSRFSRATSRDCDAAHLDLMARRKGIGLIGTGDFTHPEWRAELKEQLILDGDGVYKLRDEFRLPCSFSKTPRFVVTGEISSIYKRAGKTRKVHNLILLPSLEAADELSARLEAIGNIHSDGRPILGLDSRDLLEITLETCPEAEFIPAHIWTPHFAMFGAFSGFNSMEECFDDMTPHIHAIETGLSSDPPMNWRVSALDGLTLVSNSDAHSPSKLGREANLLDTAISYPDLVRAIRTKEGFLGTIEFFPEEGKYHLDGHRNCGICLTPQETAALGGICPVCGRKITIGVEHRVEELADRPIGFKPRDAKPFESLAPLAEVISASTGWSSTGKKTLQQYESMLHALGPEFYILRQAPISDIEEIAGPCIAEGIRRLRIGKVERIAGFDGEYGKVNLLSPSEIELFSGQFSLFGMEAQKKKEKRTVSLKTAQTVPNEETHEIQIKEELNSEQDEAVHTSSPVTAVIAGPGTGKTKTLIARISYLIEELGVRPSDITAVTFTNQAACEMRQRLEKRLGGKRTVSKMTIGTFHSICLHLLDDVKLISQAEALTLASDILIANSSKLSAKNFLQMISQVKNGVPASSIGLDEKLFEEYCDRLQVLNLVDFDDLLLKVLKLDLSSKKNFTHILVDEFQDMNDVQYALIKSWSKCSKSLFVIGDPDQSIYAFRGSSGRCFQRLADDFPDAIEIRLKENYRSTSEILACALPVIEKNPGASRILNANQGSGPDVRVVTAFDDFSEGIFIAKEIAKMTGGIDMLDAQKFEHDRTLRSFSDIAVLCRTNRQLEIIEKCLIHDDIPCVISGRGDFMDDEEVRSVLSFLHFTLDTNDMAALETSLKLIWHCPSDIITIIQNTFAKTAFEVSLLPQSVYGYGYIESFLERFEVWHKIVNKEKPRKLIEQWESLYCTTKSASIERLKNTAVFYSSMQELFNSLIIGQEADISRASGKGWKSGAVHLMTLHGSKGLEFPAVFVSGVKSAILPLESHGKCEDEEEERRLFYVGMTRAREELIITTSGEASKFLKELPSNVIRESAIKKKAPTEKQYSLF